MNQKELRQAIEQLLVDACGTTDVLVPGVDLLESELLDSLGMISLLDGLEDLGFEIQPTQVDRSCFRTLEGILSLCHCETDA